MSISSAMKLLAGTVARSVAFAVVDEVERELGHSGHQSAAALAAATRAQTLVETGAYLDDELAAFQAFMLDRYADGATPGPLMTSGPLSIVCRDSAQWGANAAAGVMERGLGHYGHAATIATAAGVQGDVVLLADAQYATRRAALLTEVDAVSAPYSNVHAAGGDLSTLLAVLSHAASIAAGEAAAVLADRLGHWQQVATRANAVIVAAAAEVTARAATDMPALLAEWDLRYQAYTPG